MKKANDLVKLLYDIDNKIGKIMIINKVINNNVLSTHDEMICPLSSRQVKYLKISTDYTYILIEM